MTRLCVLVALLAGCSTTSTSPAPGSAPGERRFSSAPIGKPLMHAGKARHKRRPLSVSRDLRRQALENRHNRTRLTVTMYCYTGSRNAAGNWPTVGTAAANAYPLGTHLAVESHGVVTVEDRSAPGATDVDLYGGNDAGCAARAAEFGRQMLDVAVVS